MTDFAQKEHEEYEAMLAWASPVAPCVHEWFGRAMPTSLDEDEAREWARANPNFSGDIPIRKPCQHCGIDFMTAVFGGLISPRFCSRACSDAALPPPAQVWVKKRKRRAKKGKP